MFFHSEWGCIYCYSMKKDNSSVILAFVAQMIKNLSAMRVTWVWYLDWEDSPGGGHGNPLQYSCLENLHGQRSLEGYSPWCHKELDTAEWLSMISDFLKLKYSWITMSQPYSNLFSYVKWKSRSLSYVQLFVTPETVACQPPLSLEFSRQEYWIG